LPRGVALTDSARELLPGVSSGFASFERAIGSLSGGDLSGRLVVTAMPSFANLWIAPRLGRFVDRYPGIQVRLCGAHEIPDLTKDEADLRIPCGRGHYPGLVTRLLMRDMIFPVCAPALLNRKPIKTMADLRRHTLIQDVEIDSEEATMDWRSWFHEAGYADLTPERWIEYDASSLVIAGALAGQGVALGRSSLVDEHLRAGRLVRPLKVELPSDFAYYTVTSRAGAERPRVRAFISWLKAEAHGDVQAEPKL
ncbi:MAG: LysR substrate-binding domain-containing protein, partial [Pseudomonadota bacterium]